MSGISLFLFVWLALLGAGLPLVDGEGRGLAEEGRAALELSPPPPGFSAVDSQDGSIVYCGASQVRLSLERRGVKLLVIRHGQSQSNADSELAGQPLLYGQSESPLTPLGVEQAQRCGGLLFQALGGEAWARQAVLDPNLRPVIISSTLLRARQTAEALVQRLRAPLGVAGDDFTYVVDGRLAETNFGRFERHPLSDVESTYPDFLKNWRPPSGGGTDYAHRFPGGESRCDVMMRITSLLNWVAETYPGRTVVLVSHSECLLASRAVLGLAPIQEGKLRAETGGIGNATPYWLVPVAPPQSP